MREIVLDTETTGLDPRSGHRIVEIGCVELINHVPSGRTYHQYINPERDMPPEAYDVHGLSEDFLAAHPTFAEIVDHFLDFVGDATLVIHNAAFDLGFLNAELERTGRRRLDNQAVDTVQMARRKFRGGQASLDALCRRFGIDNSRRDLHGALLDSELLAEVYLELIGGRQPGLSFKPETVEGDDGRRGGAAAGRGDVRPPRPHAPSPDEDAAHAAFLAKLKDPLWLAGD